MPPIMPCKWKPRNHLNTNLLLLLLLILSLITSTILPYTSSHPLESLESLESIPKTLTRSKRNLGQLVALLVKDTPYSFLKLNSYGNWCGRGGDKMGDGSYVDGCDLCCKQHDQCYYKARHEFSDCSPLFTLYDYRHGEKNPDVEIKGLSSQEERALLAKKKNPSCKTKENKGPSCKESICKCDIKFVMCLRKEPCDPKMVSDKGGYWWMPG